MAGEARSGGAGGVEQRRAGHQEVGSEKPSRGSRGRAAFPGPPRGLGRALEERRAAARGGRVAAWTAHTTAFADVRARSRRAAEGLSVCCAHPAVPGIRVRTDAHGCPARACRDTDLASRPEFQPFCACRPGWRGRGKVRRLREEAPQVFFGPLGAEGEPDRKGSRPSLCAVIVWRRGRGGRGRDVGHRRTTGPFSRGAPLVASTLVERFPEI